MSNQPKILDELTKTLKSENISYIIMTGLECYTPSTDIKMWMTDDPRALLNGVFAIIKVFMEKQDNIENLIWSRHAIKKGIKKQLNGIINEGIKKNKNIKLFTE